MKKLLIIVSLCLIGFTNLHADEYSFRKYQHVYDFYKSITLEVIEIGKKHKIPPAAILAIAGLESGYGRGYVAQITGNILSLGAFKGDKELPALYLPYSTSKKKVLFDKNEISECEKDDLAWKNRPKSLKRDYRPISYAGSSKNLELLLYDKRLRKKANTACLNDFAIRWIKNTSKVKVFKESRIWLNDLVNNKGTDVLFSKNINIDFVNRIGGHPHSFNYRQTWPKKVELIMKKVGLVELTNAMHYKKMSFEEAWRNI